MQWLAAICVKRPVFTWVLMLALVVVGVASIRGLAVDRLPNIDFPMVVVTTVLPGASPEQVETEVTDRSIPILGGLERLERINPRDSKITEAGEEQLRKLLPKLEIDHG